MPTWGEILGEISALIKARAPNDPNPFDVVRKRYLNALNKVTGRDVILYASRWTIPPEQMMDPGLVSINEEDVHGLMEVIHGLRGSALDLILHSPGGSPEAADAMVSYLREKFSDIRVIVPYAAMSAATMIACASNRIVMGRHSFLGPIDPQMVLDTALGRVQVPAQAILDQFEYAQEQCKDPSLLGSWLPILPQYGPGLLSECRDGFALSKSLVAEWLKTWMFQGRPDSDELATSIAAALSDHTRWRSHARHISRRQVLGLAGGKGLVVDQLEADGPLQEAVLSVYHAVSHTLNATPAVKIIENHLGTVFMTRYSPPPTLAPDSEPSSGKTTGKASRPRTPGRSSRR